MQSLCWTAYVVISSLLSVITFIAYGIDKRRAKTGGRRIPESRLHWLALLGGWPGAILGQQFFRHKTRKLSFQFPFWPIVILHIALIVAAVLIAIHPYQGASSS